MGIDIIKQIQAALDAVKTKNIDIKPIRNFLKIDKNNFSLSNDTFAKLKGQIIKSHALR